MQISRMTLDDLNEIKYNLETDYDDFWNYNIFKSEIENKNSFYLVAKENNTIIGFAGFMLIVDEADITNIVVKKDLRHQGIGKYLLSQLIDLIKTFEKIETITLEVNESNQNAINLYEKFDFKNLGIRKKYYRDGSNAIIMTKYLNS